MTSTEKYWERVAQAIPFFKRWDKLFDGDFLSPHWFSGARLNASFCALDHHINQGRASRTILYFESEKGIDEHFTYQELLNLTNQIASQIIPLAPKGRQIAIFMPNIPESICAMLACARLGKPFSFVFSAFSQQALRERLIDSKAGLVICVDVTYRSGRQIALKEKVKFATKDLDIKTLILKRATRGRLPKNFTQLKLDKEKIATIPLAKVESNHPLFYLYTSGTTSKPKQVMHSTAGYLVGAVSTFTAVLKPKDDGLFWCTADLGWITGHSYVAFAPLITNTRFFMYEGGPDYPDFGSWPNLIRKYKVSTFFSAPTLWRLLESELKIKPRLESLKIVGSAGEKLSKHSWNYIYKDFACKPEVKDIWWQTETGTMMLYPRKNVPGSVGKPAPGIKIGISDGQLTIKSSWPSQMINPQRKYFSSKGYLSGDMAYRDQDNNYYIVGRKDSMISISGHRLSLVEIEEIILRLPFVKDCVATGIKDEIRGQKIAVQVVLNKKTNDYKQKILKIVKKGIGAFAIVGQVHEVDEINRTHSGKKIRS